MRCRRTSPGSCCRSRSRRSSSLARCRGPFGALFVAWFYRRRPARRAVRDHRLCDDVPAFAAPGVPRGAFLMLAPLFLAIGLPVEGIGILIAVDAIPDLFATVLNASGDLAAAALVARYSTKAA